MKKIFSAFLLSISFLAFALEPVKSGDSLKDSADLANRRTALSCLSNATNYASEKNFDAAVSEIERFLPFVDNWATCDQLRPRCFQRNRRKLLPYIRKWIASDETYTIRFGVGMLMVHFLDEDFEASLLELPAGVHSEEYYVRMMIAWYFATALAKQYDAALPYISGYKLDKWTHNKTIQKAIESNRVAPERKQELVGYRLK